MNKISFIILLSILSSATVACEGKIIVPIKVQESFEIKFSNIKKVQWESEANNEWEAEFKKNGNEYSAKFNKEGVWLETEYEIKIKNLPEAVKNKIQNNYNGYKIEEAEHISTPKYEVVFEIEIENGVLEIELIIDSEGNIISEKNTTVDDDEN